MRKPVEHFSLTTLNTFGVPATARYFFALKSGREWEGVRHILSAGIEALILGGGSNVLFTGDVEKLVLQSCLTERKVLFSDDKEVIVSAGSGISWDDWVVWCLTQGFYGLENLSLIPGTVGAAPVQNIGAYGVEAGDMIVSVEGIDLLTGDVLILDHEACHFGYRTSIFKEKLLDTFLITGVVFRLSRIPASTITYPQLAEAAKELKNPSPQKVRELVIKIRREKLPDPKAYKNAGSFFKNPVVPNGEAERLKETFPGVPLFPFDEGHQKIPAGWLIEKCGWKGIKEGVVGVWDKQALVIVNYKQASGKEILKFSERIREDVLKKTGILLEPEVRII